MLLSCFESQQSLNSSLNAESFQMIVPYLDGFAIENPGSVVGFDRDSETNVIKSLHVSPSFMNKSLHFVRPVISVDACHLKSMFMGTLYIDSVLSGHNTVYPAGFLIGADGNEDGVSWTMSLENLKEACPMISESGKAINREPDEECFLFISDRNKGLIPVL